MFENIPPWAMNQNQSAFNMMPSILSQYTAGGTRPPPNLAAGAAQPQQQQAAMPAPAPQQNPMGDPMALMKLLTTSNNPQTASAGSGGVIQQIAAMLNGRQSGMSGMMNDAGQSIWPEMASSSGGSSGLMQLLPFLAQLL